MAAQLAPHPRGGLYDASCSISMSARKIFRMVNHTRFNIKNKSFLASFYLLEKRVVIVKCTNRSLSLNGGCLNIRILMCLSQVNNLTDNSDITY